MNPSQMTYWQIQQLLYEADIYTRHASEDEDLSELEDEKAQLEAALASGNYLDCEYQ